MLEEQYEKVYDYRDTTQLTIDYEQGDILIIFNQYLLHNYKNRITYENAVSCEVSIGEYKGILVEQTMGTQCVRTLIWCDGEYAYTLSGNVTKDVLVSAAESLR